MTTSRTVEVVADGDRDIVVRRSFDAPRRLVADAHTKPELLRRWLGVFGDWQWAECDVDLRVGGRYRWVWRQPSGEELALSGEFREVVPDERYVFTQVYENMPQFPGEMLVTMTLAEDGGRTALEMTSRYASKAGRDLDLQYMPSGLEPGYVKLDEVLASLHAA